MSHEKHILLTDDQELDQNCHKHFKSLLHLKEENENYVLLDQTNATFHLACNLKIYQVYLRFQKKVTETQNTLHTKHVHFFLHTKRQEKDCTYKTSPGFLYIGSCLEL